MFYHHDHVKCAVENVKYNQRVVHGSPPLFRTPNHCSGTLLRSRLTTIFLLLRLVDVLFWAGWGLFCSAGDYTQKLTHARQALYF